MIKIISISLNAFIPNAWDHLVTQSVYEPEIYFNMRERLITEDEIKETSKYCESFVEKVCRSTSLKAMHYLRFEELIPFLKSPCDARDAASIFKGISPYSKSIKKRLEVCSGKETLEIKSPLPSDIDPKLVNTLVKPRDLLKKTIEGKDKCGVCLLAYTVVIEEMTKLETAFIVDQRKMDLILNLASLYCGALSDPHLKDFVNDQSVKIYEAMAEVIANRNASSYSSALSRLADCLVYKRDKLGLKNIIMLALNKPELKGEIDNSILESLTYDFVEAIKISDYPQDQLYSFHYSF
jgi:hypothetical protein